MVFLPASFIGWAISLVAIAYAIYAFVAISGSSLSASDTLINFIASLTIITAAYTVIAYFTCARAGE
jgi:hypothetical protein